MTCNRLLDFALWVRGQLDGLQPQALMELERMLEIEPYEALAYQQHQARARMRGILNGEEALLIYRALDSNGWTPGLGLELKVTIVALMNKLSASHATETSAIHASGTRAGGSGTLQTDRCPRDSISDVSSSPRPPRMGDRARSEGHAG